MPLTGLFDPALFDILIFDTGEEDQGTTGFAPNARAYMTTRPQQGWGSITPSPPVGRASNRTPPVGRAK